MVPPEWPVLSPTRSRSPKRGVLRPTIAPHLAPSSHVHVPMKWAEVCKTESESESGQCDSPSPREDPRPRCGRMALQEIQLPQVGSWSEAKMGDLKLKVVPDDSSSGECSPEPGVRLPRFARHRPLPPPPPPRPTTPQRTRPRPVGGALEDQRSMSPFGKEKAPRRGADSGGFKSWGAFGMAKTPEDGAAFAKARLKALLPGKQICFFYLSGKCSGENCSWYHPEEREVKEEVRCLMRMIPCKSGLLCQVRGCVFGHWDEEKQEPSGAQECSSDAGSGSQDSGASVTSCSTSDRSTMTSSDCEESEEPDEPEPSRQQFLQTKVARALIFQGPGFCVLSKPAGWSASMSRSGAEDDSERPVGLKEVMCSGRVEPLMRHPAAPVGSWKPLLSPSPMTSGPALMVQTSKARRRLARAFQTGRVVTYSLALVPGKMDLAQTSAACRRPDGVAEVLALADLHRVSKEDWGGEASCESYTLVLVKAAGSALGGERRLLQLAWGKAAVGDTENGGIGTDQGLGGRPFFHTLATVLADPWWWADTTYPAVMVCHLPEDLCGALAQLEVSLPPLQEGGEKADEQAEREVASAAAIGISIKEALLKMGLLPAELTASLGVPPECGIAAEKLPQADPAPYGMARWTTPRWADDVPRCRWVLSFILQVLARAEVYQLSYGTDGWIQLRALFWRFPQLQEASFGTVHWVARLAVKDPTRAVEAKIVNGYVSVRRVSGAQRLQAFVEDYASSFDPDTELSVAELMSNSHVKKLFNGSELPQGRPLLELIRSCALFEIDPKATALRLRPAAERFRLGLEQLFRQPPAALHGRLSERGTVSLSWLLRTFAHQLLGNLRFSPQQALEALSPSQELILNPKTLAVEPRGQLSLPESLADVPASRERMIYMSLTHGGRRRPQLHDQTWIQPAFGGLDFRIVRKLREILDFYMHPFSIQHNALLRHGAEQGSWAWPLKRLASQLPRVEVILAPVDLSLMPRLLQALCEEPGEYMEIVSNVLTKQPLVKPRYTPDFRMPVVRSSESWVPKHFAANYEERPQIPDDAAVILSYNLLCKQGPDHLALQSSGTEAFLRAPRLARQRWRFRVMRQLVAYQPDIICLQHVEAELSSPFCSRTEGMTGPVKLAKGGHLLNEIIKKLEEDFDWCAAPGSTDWANAVFWKCSKWCLQNWDGFEGNMQVSLVPAMAMTDREPLTIGNMAAQCEKDFGENLESMQAMLPPWESASVLCAASGIDISDGARDILKKKGLQFRSAHKEVLGHELPWTEIVDDQLRCSDGVWIREPLTALAVLDGHKPHRNATGEICRQTMPADHLLSLVVVQSRGMLPNSMDLCMQ